jgi:hypothetical protein
MPKTTPGASVPIASVGATTKLCELVAAPAPPALPAVTTTLIVAPTSAAART